ncbi:MULTISPECIES: thioesterase family protein [Rhodococcus]|uniref:acyl-CoA thioesterase n=1 Tax=Rhodococcus TaxID=1827 RepID=UPI00163B2849|nr:MULTISPECIES: thioesterase family protein [Rhodococcus]MBC2587070.1 acyl-CoA thioesterase [Rhodococcus aetherivorans]QRI74828.1 acyl-CoA thioesterase [Rhodococcus aetherivorans]QSE58238.1 acyl-CoA thioesterase [Rhodococcus sp. PSBB066]QSE70440.1 acyl-CoA thioesterase [Rhodococcus sp. PSBB049]
MTEPGQKTFTCTLEVRWADSDRLGHVNNTKFVEYMQEARIKFLQSGPFARGAVVVRKMDVEFLRPLKDDSGPITVAISVLHVGNSSYTLRHVITDVQGNPCGSGDAVLVGFDPRTETSRPLSAEERAVLEEYVAATVG